MSTPTEQAAADGQRAWPHRFQASAVLGTSAAEVFALLDDPHALASHMGESSWMMAGSRMSIETDAAGGRAVGSHIRMCGRVLGLKLSLDEVVVERAPPYRKTWQTVGSPRLLVIGAYRMGFEIDSAGERACRLTVFIDYELAESPLGRALGRTYARWCTRQMVDDAQRRFAAPPVGAEPSPIRADT